MGRCKADVAMGVMKFRVPALSKVGAVTRLVKQINLTV